MMDKNFQSDLFGNGVRGDEKKKKPREKSKYPERMYLPQIKMPIEYTIIFSIGVLVLTIIAYAVGVERGKNLVFPERGEAKEKVFSPLEIDPDYAKKINQVQDQDVEVSGDSSFDISKPVSAEKVIRHLSRVVEWEEDIDAAPDVEKPEQEVLYIVQLASFKKMSAAENEVKKLKKKKNDANLEKAGQWYQVYAVGYRTIAEAKKARQEFSIDYKDCYIRQQRN